MVLGLGPLSFGSLVGNPKSTIDTGVIPTPPPLSYNRGRDICYLSDFSAYDPTGVNLSDQAFLDAIAQLPNGGTIFIPQHSNLSLATALVCNKSILFKSINYGDDSSNTNGSGASPALPRITWTGASGATMLTIVSATSGNVIWGGGSEGIEWDGGSLADTCIHLNNTKYSRVYGKFRNAKVQAVLCDSVNGNAGNFSEHNDFDIEYIWGASSPCQNSNGLTLAGNGSTVPSTQQRVRKMAGLVYTGAMLQISQTDNCVIGEIHCAVQTAGGLALYLKAAGSAGAADGNVFTYINGPIKQDNGLYGNIFLSYNSEGGGISSGGNGSTINSWVGELSDYVTGERFTSHKFALREKISIPSASFKGDANTSTGLYAGIFQNITLPDAVTSTASCMIPARYDFAGGVIEGIEFTVAANGASGGNYAFVTKCGSGVSAASFTSPTSLSSTVAAGTTNVPVTFTATFGTPITFTKGNLIAIMLERDGASGTDTNTNSAYFLGARLLYRGTGPASGGSGTYDIPAWG